MNASLIPVFFHSLSIFRCLLFQGCFTLGLYGKMLQEKMLVSIWFSRSNLCYLTYFLIPKILKTKFQLFTNDKIFDETKAFADHKNNAIEKMKCILGMGRKLCGIRRKCWLPMFSKGFCLRVV